MTSIPLLGCPFCGSAARLFHDTNSDYERQWEWVAECTNADHCGAMTGYEKNKIDAAALWNRRNPHHQ